MEWHTFEHLVLFATIFGCFKGIMHVLKNLPDLITEKMIEKLREEEKRKQAEQNKT